MEYIQFAEHKQNKSKLIVEIKYDTCSSSTVCKMLLQTKEGQWWGIFSPDLPIRFVCMRDENAVKYFAKHYALLESSECINDNGRFGLSTTFKPDPTFEPIVNSIKAHYAHGIPQRTQNSGLCWYSAMCFACFYCIQMRDLVKMHSNDDKLNSLIDECLSVPKRAEELRHYLYYKYHIGDDPKQSPEKDGQNGLSEYLVLCAKLGIPCIRLFAPNLSTFNDNISDKKGNVVSITKPMKNKPSLLVVRCFRTKWKPPFRLVHDGILYKMVSVLIGSEHCGHQIGASTCNGHICRWACSDADARKEGIGPIFWKVRRTQSETQDEFITRWWDIWGRIIPLTLFNSGSFCDFSPHNRATCTMNKNNTSTCNSFDAGIVNSDFMYMSV